MNNVSVSVPVERFRQLQRLAEIDQCSITDVIGDFVNDAIYEDRLPAGLPGWIIQRIGDHIRFVVEDAEIERKLSPTVAIGLAETFEKLSVQAGRARAVLDLDANLQVERRGTSVKIVDPDTGAYRATARSVAQDAAHLLRQEAA